MKLFLIYFCLIFFYSFSHANAESDSLKKLKLGASTYRNCYYCHSLKPDVHLTGPSLYEIWGKKAGTVKGYTLYSDDLKKIAPEWNEANIKSWITNPKALVPHTSMTFEGYGEDTKSVESLMAFLKIALGPKGYAKVIEDNLLDQQTADGQLPKNLNTPVKQDIVAAIEHCSNMYILTDAAGIKTKYWEMNLDFKVDSSKNGPPKRKPVRISIGSMGDRFAVVFNNPAEIKQFLTSCKN